MRKQSLRWPALLLVLGMAACNPGACVQNMVEEAIEAETGVEVDLDADSGAVTFRGGDGDTFTFSGNEDGIELPGDFPSAIPVYPDAQAIQYAKIGDAVQAGFQIDAAVADVRDWYVAQLEDQDWVIQMNAITPDGGLMVAELEGETLSIMLATDGDQTTIMITLARD